MNRQRWTTFIMTFGFGFCVVFVAGYMTQQKTEQVMVEQGLPSISAIQEKLNELEPENPLRIDGKFGPATQEKWDRVYIRESAKLAWNEFENKKGN